ncbi:MAG TPA: hypothetical protein VHU84_15835 [Lacipirellulaceae bacterium]|nr:hypothetical protein [Lacipirellulaceae bacterium]
MASTSAPRKLRSLNAGFLAAAVVCSAACVAEDVDSPLQPPGLPSIQEMIAARTDVWGDAAMQQPNGASYEFFKDLLPPLRWVNTDFRHYPIVLSAPRAPQKARLVSNGSAVNPRANKPPMWNEQGVPVVFFVGETQTPFGEDLAKLEEPRYLDGYLPVVSIGYEHDDIKYREEAFAPVEAAEAASGAILVRFSVTSGTRDGKVEARIGSPTPLHEHSGAIANESGATLLTFSSSWKWDAEHKALSTSLAEKQTAELNIFTKPSASATNASSTEFDRQRQTCIEAWKKFVDHGITLVSPEAIVNDAWRSLLVGTYMLAVNDRLNYSAGNAYAKLYEAECGDTLKSIMLFGHLEDAPAMLKLLLQFDRKATRFHVAGHKLQLLAYFYWLTRDSTTIRADEPLWRPSVDLILSSREATSGLLPKDNYAGDIAEQVYSLNSNANCWRGLRDVAAMLDDMGSHEEAKKLQQTAEEYRRAIIVAVEKSERLDAKPPFIPVALLADEPAHDPLTDTRKGSYYDLICPYVIGSEIFGQSSKRETNLLSYMQQHGGIAMGMVRTKPSEGQFKNEPGVVPLYGLRYQLALLRRGEREKALVGFYGQLAQGMARSTFIGGEGSRFVHGDVNGRSFYLPPNSTSNAAWLVALRYLIIQDWDLDGDAKPDTLRLMFATPREWLADGNDFQVDRAPTMFGPMSLSAHSRLSDGYVEFRVMPPSRPTSKTLLRAALPSGWKITSAEVDHNSAAVVGSDVVDLTGLTKPLVVKFYAKRL